jgi:hypothetical protein
MEDKTLPRRADAPVLPARRAWEEPAVLLERPLEVAGEGAPPAGWRDARVRSNGYLAPLGSSGRQGVC